MKKQILQKLVIYSGWLMILFISACRREDNNSQTIDCTDINADVTWEDRGDGVDYTLTCVLNVNAKLTIEPGVVIVCKSGSGIVINSGGALKAVGTTDKKIEFKGETDVQGAWKGLYFKSNSVFNELNHCIVANAGSASFDGNAARKANIRVALNAQLKIRNTIVSKSAKDGLYVDGLESDELNPITSFSMNEFTQNAEYPISAIGPTATQLDGMSSTFTGNGRNKVLLRGGRLHGAHT
ncbi:MAG: hypothetical protein RML37_07770, partial [Chitinophagales bacterium]|nr:hypothetical protein [Chitinophagales bacterium]